MERAEDFGQGGALGPVRANVKGLPRAEADRGDLLSRAGDSLHNDIGLSVHHRTRPSAKELRGHGGRGQGADAQLEHPTAGHASVGSAGVGALVAFAAVHFSRASPHGTPPVSRSSRIHHASYSQAPGVCHP